MPGFNSDTHESGTFEKCQELSQVKVLSRLWHGWLTHFIKQQMCQYTVQDGKVKFQKYHIAVVYKFARLVLKKASGGETKPPPSLRPLTSLRYRLTAAVMPYILENRSTQQTHHSLLKYKIHYHHFLCLAGWWQTVSWPRGEHQPIKNKYQQAEIPPLCSLLPCLTPSSQTCHHPLILLSFHLLPLTTLAHSAKEFLSSSSTHLQ